MDEDMKFETQQGIHNWFLSADFSKLSKDEAIKRFEKCNKYLNEKNEGE